VAAVSAALSGDPDDLAALQQIPAAVEAALKLDSEAEQLAARYADLGYCIVLGRGFSYCTAQEWALKLKELAYVFAEVYSTPDFQHGPIAILEPGFPVLAVAPSGAVLPDYLEILRRLRDEYRADLLVLSDSDSALEIAGAGLRLPGGLPEWLTPVVDIVPAQLFCYHLTRLKGYDTEQPRTLRKITLTR
jgi:glucosamine--fructose-6-phosphate aminotransferase (isomerizing)